MPDPVPGPPSRRAAALGILIGAVGLLCFGGGIMLLIWRLVEPDRSVILPPGADLEVTPTPGLLGSPLPPPALPADDTALVILPVDERPTATLTAQPTTKPTVRPVPSHTPLPTNTATSTPHPTAAPTHTQLAPTVTVTIVVISTQTAVPLFTVAPSVTPTPTLTPTAPTVNPPDIPDRILISSIGLDAPVLPVGQHAIQIGKQTYSQMDVPSTFAAGWEENSAPLGRAGNTVINGHHNAYGEVFRYLINAVPGDTLILDAKGRRYTYVIAQTMVLPEEGEPLDVRRENARWILPTADERVTLITCWPYSSSTHRLIVIALPIASPERPSDLP